MLEISRISNVWLENCLTHLPSWSVCNLEGNSWLIKSPCYMFFLLVKIQNLELRLRFVSCATFLFLTWRKRANKMRWGHIRYSPYFVGKTVSHRKKNYVNGELYKQLPLMGCWFDSCRAQKEFEFPPSVNSGFPRKRETLCSIAQCPRMSLRAPQVRETYWWAWHTLRGPSPSRRKDGF